MQYRAEEYSEQTSKKCPAKIPTPGDTNVTQVPRRDFRLLSKVTKQLVLKEGADPSLSRGAQCNHMSPVTAKERKRLSKRFEV